MSPRSRKPWGEFPPPDPHVWNTLRYRGIDIRSLAGGGSHLIATSPVGSQGPLFGNAVYPSLGTRPAFPGKAPPVRGNVACYKNAAPDLNRTKTGGAP